MIAYLEQKVMLENLLRQFKNVDVLLDYCQDAAKIMYAKALKEEIDYNTKHLDLLIHQAERGDITTEMACLDMDYWTDDGLWKALPRLFEPSTYGEEAAANSLLEAIDGLLARLATLENSLKHVPGCGYERFHGLSTIQGAARAAKRNYEIWKEDFMTDGLVAQELLDKRQSVIYEFYKSGFLRFEQGSKQKQHKEHIFKFDFGALPTEAVDCRETDHFCVCLDRYVTMVNKWSMILKLEKLGRYLFRHFLELRANDHYALTYFEVMLELIEEDLEGMDCTEVAAVEKEQLDGLLVPEAMVLWEKLKKAGYVDQELKPMQNLTNTQLAIIVDEFCGKLHMRAKWTYFERLWHKKNMRGYNNRSLNQENSFVFRNRIQQVFE